MPSDRRRRRVLLAILLAIALVTMFVLADVLATVFFAVTVAYVLYPVRQWLIHRGRGRRVSAAVATLVGFLAVLLAFVPIVAALYGRRHQFLVFVRTLPPTIPVSAYGFQYTIDVSVVLALIQRTLTSIAVQFASAAPVVGLKLALFVFLVYALLLRPHDMRAAAFAFFPTGYHDVVVAFHERVRSTLYAIYVLQAATAFGTFLIAYVVFAVLGYDSSLMLAVISGVLQFIPVVGPSVVVLGLAGYQLVVGNTGAAILVTTFGLVLVGFLPDAIIRTRLASFTAGMPASLYFVGFTGGVLTIGPIGFIAGPLVVAVLLEAGQLLSEEMGVEATGAD
ncbi:MAG: AI-2E family transporter [Halorientalis sp.]